MSQLKKSKTSKGNSKNGIPLISSIIVICALIVFIIMFLPFISSIFGNKSYICSLKSLLSITNNLGGTIGGILGPIVALLAALLTYWAFMEQVKANNLQFAEIKRIKFDETFSLLLSIYRENVQKIESQYSFREIYEEFKFIYCKIDEEVYNEFKRSFTANRQTRIYDNYNQKDIIDLAIGILIFGLENIYDSATKEIKINISSKFNQAYINALDQLVIINSAPPKMYFDVDYSHIKFKFKKQVNSLKGYGRSIENYFNNIETILKHISNYWLPAESIDESSDYMKSFNIFESQLTNDELFLLYFYGQSSLSTSFGDLFYESDLIKSVSLAQVTLFYDTMIYNSRKVRHFGGRYKDYFKS